jgi:hypothetical protein
MTHDPARTGIVAGGTGGVWRVLTDDGELLDASLRGRLKRPTSGVGPAARFAATRSPRRPRS